MTYSPYGIRPTTDSQSATLCPTPTLTVCHSSSALAILVARYLLALTAADQLQAQVPLLIVVSPASCVVFGFCLCLSACVRAFDAIQHPAPLVAALPAVVGIPATRTVPKSLLVCVSYLSMTVTHIPAARAERRDAMRKHRKGCMSCDDRFRQPESGKGDAG